ncbi:MAG: GntR family transcriptional regulator [Lachnospiraceae bacterium]
MIQLNYRDSRPIYQQIKVGLRKLMVTHAIEANEKLPSVRELAAKLAINPNTIQRAYRELEGEGYLYTISGKGTFAAEQEWQDRGRKEELIVQFDEVVAELLYLSIDYKDLIQRVHKIEERRIVE